MVIMLTNDDGSRSYGIRDLCRALSAEHEVYVVAPDRERSAASHAVTFHKPLRAREIEIDGASRSWETNGTPSDCVKLGFYALLPKKPDILVSGINRGANLGTDVLYSGTVAAAMEGAFLGLPSLATSFYSFERKNNYSLAARLISKLIERIKGYLENGIVLNVNVPDCLEEDIRGFKLSRLQVRNYNNMVEERVDPKGEKYYWLYGEPNDASLDPTSDIYAVKNNYVSITPLYWDLTNSSLLKKLSKLSIFDNF